MAAQYLAARGVDLDTEMAKVQFGEMGAPEEETDIPQNASLSKIIRACLPRKPTSSRWDITILDGCILSVDPHDDATMRLKHLPGILDAHGRLLVPSLCHAHIHLDKCFLLQDPKYEDLEIVRGDFQEAMSLTTQAKARFEEEDLLRRGGQLIEESIEVGVTAMRAFIEIDDVVNYKCLDAGLKLKSRFRSRCDLQICVFAQLPVFSGDDGGEKMRFLLEDAIQRDGVDVIGSTPYVEEILEKREQNVSWIIDMALKYGKHLDMHLDYHLNQSEITLFYALEQLENKHWKDHAKSGRTIVFGHCTALTTFSRHQWKSMRSKVGELPVSFVGLPTSDLFMMDRPAHKEGSSEEVGGHNRLRGTLQILHMIEEDGFQGAIAINNVGNAFTPHGSCDPLSLASSCVGIYQAGTKQQAELLFECVSGRAKSTIGLPAATLDLRGGQPADFVLFGKVDDNWRRRKTIAHVVYDAGHCRLTMKNGRVTSRTPYV